MLNGIHLVDFGNHRNTRLTFGRMTALVGQNGAGKTTVMRALGELERAVGCQGSWGFEGNALRVGGKEAIVTASWAKRIEDVWLDYGLNLGPRLAWYIRRRVDKNEPIWMPEAIVEPARISIGTGLTEPSLSDMEPGSLFRLDETRLRWSSRYFKPSTSALQNASFAEPGETVLNSAGSNLAWALASMMTEHPDRFQRVVEALREVVPVVKRIRSRPVSLSRLEKQTITINNAQERTFDAERSVPGQELIFDMRSGENLPANSVSEGTLVVLAALTLIYGNEQANLIMLDDVELGLHPKAQRDLFRQLRRIQENHPKLQIILSTHSPYIVDEMKPEEVWVLAPDPEGCAVVHRLDEHPDAKRSLEVLTTGEFWSAEGEGWVLEGNAGDTTPEATARVAEEPAKE